MWFCLLNLKIGGQIAPLNESACLSSKSSGNWKQTCIVSLISSLLTGVIIGIGTLYFVHIYPGLNPITNLFAKHNSPLPQPTTTLAPAITTPEDITKKYKECVQNLKDSEIMFNIDNVQYTTVKKHNKRKYLDSIQILYNP